MTKIGYLRKCAAEKYHGHDLAAAAEIGEVLLREHWHNKNFRTSGYANDLFNLACVHDEMGNLERAAMLYSDSAAQISMAEGENLPFAERLNNLATVLLRLGSAEPAFFMLGNVTAIRKRELGANNPLYADSLYNLANAAHDAGRKTDSVKYHLEALQIRKNEGHTDDIISSLHSLAFLHEAALEYEKAEIYAESAMHFSAGDDKAYAAACNYLAELYDNSGKFDDALPLYDSIRELLLLSDEVGREHSAYLNVSLRRANLLSKMGLHHESLEAHEEVGGIFARISGTNHVFYANCLRGISMLYRNLGEPDLAEKNILEAMKIRRMLLEDITLDITFLIRLYLGEGEHEKALEALIYAMMCASANSPDFPELLRALISSFREDDERKHEFLTAIKLLDDREKLGPILQKWDDWERE